MSIVENLEPKNYNYDINGVMTNGSELTYDEIIAAINAQLVINHEYLESAYDKIKKVDSDKIFPIFQTMPGDSGKYLMEIVSFVQNTVDYDMFISSDYDEICEKTLVLNPDFLAAAALLINEIFADIYEVSFHINWSTILEIAIDKTQ